MKRYSARVREQAALICQVAASNGAQYWNYSHTARRLGISAEAELLAFQAWRASCQLQYLIPDRDAEAESLLRCGWSPWSFE